MRQVEPAAKKRPLRPGGKEFLGEIGLHADLDAARGQIGLDELGCLEAQRVIGRAVGDLERRAVGDAGDGVRFTHTVAVFVVPASGRQEFLSGLPVVTPGGQRVAGVEGVFGREVTVRHAAGWLQRLPVYAQRNSLPHPHILEKVGPVVGAR